MRARFDDLVSGTAFELGGLVRQLSADEITQVAKVLSEAEDAANGGAWVAGYVAYEAAPAFDANLDTRDADRGLPLAWFGVFSERVEVPAISAPAHHRGTEWRLDWSSGAHADAVVRIKEHLAAGDTYQVNLTVRAGGEVGDPYGLYCAMASAQGGRYNGFIDTGHHAIVCASPELFFERRGGELITRPMKGTRRRGRWPEEDLRLAGDLTGSAKDRAEHVMIVDLLRNDLGRIARPGTVEVRGLFDLERYRTVWQLTSTVGAHTEASLVEVFAALFPSGSVTGAPKQASMAIISGLETSPRRLYCGTVGYLTPGVAARACFAVAIRTATVDLATGVGVYGSGGGITWDSDPGEEWRELQDKCAVLDAGPHPTGLFETLRYDPTAGPVDWDRHLDRLAGSAAYFAFPFDRSHIDRQVRHACGAADHPARVRVELSGDGTVTVALGPLPEPDTGPVRLAIAHETVSSWDTLLFHKTVDRTRYERIRRSRPDVDDLIITNEHGDVTETTIANLAVQLDPGGRWWTPPVAAGLLPGTERRRLIEAGRLAERTISAADLIGARSLATVNSLRGWRPAVLDQG